MSDTTSNQLEQTLKEVFVDKAPALPDNGKKLLVQYAPWLALIGGVLSAWAAWNIWQWAHVANGYIDYANRLSEAFGGGTVATSRLSTGIWIGMAVLAVQAALLLLAFPGLRDHKKQGWNMVYYSALVSVAYGVVVMFTSYGDAGNLIASLVGAAIGLYFLFQIRSSYVHSKTAANTGSSAPQKS